MSTDGSLSNNSSQNQINKSKVIFNEKLLEKFQSLQKRRHDLSKKFTDRRIKDIQMSALEQVTRSFHDADDLSHIFNQTRPGPSENVICSDLRSNNEDLVHDIKDSISSTSTLKAEGANAAKPSSASLSVNNSSLSQEQDWLEVRQYIDINKHLQVASCARDVASTKLEEKLNEAVAMGEFDTADKISNRLAARQFGEKVAQAFDAQRYVEKRKKADEKATEKRKKTLHWGFNHKERWETKGNM